MTWRRSAARWSNWLTSAHLQTGMPFRRLLVSATDLKEGQIEYFYSQKESLTLDHIMASCSMPPAFPMTVIDRKPYWDGGLFDNTPLGAVLDKLDNEADVDRTVYVVNLFPNKAPIPVICRRSQRG